MCVCVCVCVCGYVGGCERETERESFPEKCKPEVLQYIVVCCSVLQCVAVYCSVLQSIAVCCSIL